MGITTRQITYEESLALHENKLEEIVDGEIRLTPPPSRGHAALIERLAEVLRAQLDRDAFRVKTSSFGQGIRRRPYLTYRGPDLAVFLVSELAKENDHYIWVVPELIVECLSPANRKGAVEELVRDYASISVPELWLAYPEHQIIEIHVLHEKTLRKTRGIVDGPLTPLRLPQAAVEVRDLWSASRGV